MRSVLVVSVLALLCLEYVHSAPQNIGTILRNSTLTESEAETSGFESGIVDDVSNIEDSSEVSTLEGRNETTNADEHGFPSTDYDYDDSKSSEKYSEVSSSSIVPETSTFHLSEQTGNNASNQSDEGKETTLTTSVSVGTSKELLPENKIESSSAVYIGNGSEGNDTEVLGVEGSVDVTNLPSNFESTETTNVDPKVTKSHSNDDSDDYNDDIEGEEDIRISSDEKDYEEQARRRSDEFIEREEGDHDELGNTSPTMSDTSPLPQKSSAQGASEKLVLNSENFGDDANISVNNSATEADDRTGSPITTVIFNNEGLRFRNEELVDLIAVTDGTEKATVSTFMTDRSDRLTLGTVSPSADIVGLHADEDALKRITSGIPTTTFETSEKSAAPASLVPNDSSLFEGRSAVTSSPEPDAVTDDEATVQQEGSEVPKISADIVSVITTLDKDPSSFSSPPVSVLEESTASSPNASSETFLSGDFTGSPEDKPGTTFELTSQGDQTVSVSSEEPTLLTEEVLPAKSTSDTSVEINDDSFSTLADDTLPQSDANSDIPHTGTTYPAADIAPSTPTFEEEAEGEERLLELKVIDSSSDHLDKFDTPPEDRTTTSSFSATDSKEPATTAKERTTTLIWHGPTVLPRQTTTTLSEISTTLTETEPIPSKNGEVEMKQEDGKDLFNTRFSDRYLSGNNTDMVAAVQFLHYHDKASSEQCFKLVDTHWNYATNLTEENKRKQLQQTLEYSLFHKSAWKNATSFAWKSFNDTLIRRWFKSLSILGNAALPEDKLTEFNQLKAEMKNTYSTAKVCPYRKSEERNSSIPERCNLSLEPDLQSILMKSRDYDELVHVWKSWRDSSGKQIREKFLRFVELSNEAATLNGFPDTGDMWREAYESDTFQQDLDLLWEQLRPLYEHLHAYVRRKLINEYGSDRIRQDGPIPAHLFGNMWAQSWVSLLDITQPFPGKPSVDVTPTMVAKNMTALDMFKTSEEFFTSLGLKAMPSEFWKHSLIEKPKDREIICHASAWDFCNGKDYRIKQCTVITMEDLITVHHEMGHIQYFMQYARQPNVFREGANPGFHEAIGDVLALSVSTPRHLLSIGLLDEIADDPEGDLNFLLRTALEKVSFLPSGYLIDLWRWGLFSGEIKYEEMNRKWWELRLKYQGICPPVQRNEEDFDPGAKYHVAGNVPYIRYFVSFVIQFQFHKVLCDAAGHTGPLYKCDIYRSKEAGQILSQVMELGSSEHWSEAMRIMTGGAQTKMDAQPIMEYFGPLLKWLIEQNKNETLGWKSDDATVCP